MNCSEVLDQFISALAEFGIAPSEPSEIVADGELHRFHVQGDKARTKNGWFVLHSDGLPAGEFGSWKDAGASHTWRANIGRQWSKSEKAESSKRIEAARAARSAALEAERRRARSNVAKLWKGARTRVRVTHPYLVEKGVRPFGIRQLREQLLIPVRDSSGTLHGLQWIQPDGSKKFSTGTDKRGHYCPIGKACDGDVLAIVEGWATGSTVHALTGWAVAVAFDAGNLRPVAEALRTKLPNVRLVICADNDHATEGNPGMVKAREAGKANGASIIAPVFEQDEVGTDWNDYAAAHGEERARDALLSGVELASSKQAENDQTIAKKSKSSDGASPINTGNKALREPGTNSTNPPARKNRNEYPAGFTLDHEGIWFRGRGKGNDDGLEQPFRIGPPLSVLAFLRDTEQDNWGLLLEWCDRDGHTHRWGMPWRMLSASGEEMRSELLRQGFFVPPSQRARSLFLEYLAQAKPLQNARSVERTGWHGEGERRVFVLPDRTIGEAPEPVYFQSESLRDRVYREAGELSDWRSDVADLCRGNSRLVFSVSMAFASMLMFCGDDESGGVHLRGGSSTGKTTALRVAASVFGGTEYLRRWNTTANGLEPVAAMHNDALLTLDELAQIEPKAAGAAAYALGNGTGKQRAHRGGSARPVLRWRLLFLSAGEISLAEHMRQDGKKAQAGQETRLAEIPADAGAGLGLFEGIHGHDDAASFSQALTANAARTHGTAAPAFIAAILRHGESLSGELREARAAFCSSVLPPKADGQAWRVASRFSLIAAAGELATQYGITAWEAGESDRAAMTCFRAWLDTRGGAGNVEPLRMISQVRQFLERHGEARFASWKDDGSNDWVTKDRAGFRKPHAIGGSLESADAFYVLRETFREEICAGFDHRDVARALAEAGTLDRDEKSRKHTKRVRLPRLGNTWCYVILPAIWRAGEAEGGEPSAKDGSD